MTSIYVNYHNRSHIFSNEILKPLHVGKALSSMDLEIPHDAVGAHISDRNKEFCELTGQYHVWKNEAHGDFVGFMHYRRMFDFSGQKRALNLSGTVDVPAPYDGLLNDFGLTESAIQDYLVDCDVVVPVPFDVRQLGSDSVHDQYLLAPFHFIEHLDEAGRILAEKYPADVKFYDRAMAGHALYPNNMFVMRAELFSAYSAWLFDILFELDRRIDVSKLGVQEQRAIGYVAERLFTVYVLKLSEDVHCRVKTAHRVFIEDTASLPHAPPAPRTSLPVITLAAATDAAYAQHVGALISSVLQTVDRESFIDFFVLDGGIKPEDKRRLLALAPLHPHARITLIDMANQFLDIEVNSYFTRGTFFRLALPEILHDRDKVLFLDADMVVLKDVAPLFQTDVTGFLVAATRDLVMRAFCAMGVPSHTESGGLRAARYLSDRLGIASGHDYFQAGVLVFNLAEMRRTRIARKMVHALKTERFWFLDQDVLNKFSHGRVRYVDGRWNSLYMDEHHSSALDAASLKEYNRAWTEPWIVHYAGVKKPWVGMAHPYANEYWQALRATGWYERALFQLLGASGRASGFAPRDDGASALHRKSLSLWLVRRAWQGLPDGVKQSLVPVGTWFKRQFATEI